MAESGRVFNQTPDSFFCAARRQAQDILSAANLSNFLKAAYTLGATQLFWHVEAVAGGGDSSCPSFQIFNASLCRKSETSPKQGRRSWLMRTEEPTAEAKKAEGASWVTVQIPSTPDQTGREAWVRAVSSRRFMLAIDPNKDLCSRSKPSNSVERKQEDCLKV